jgi:octaprenyl-diphosphate synthase
VHMATLVHDDVLDEAEMRRRGKTVNRLHGNEAAVILGDYLIAGAYHLCSTLPTSDASVAVGRASMVTCAGELLQLHHRDDYSLDEPTYFEIVARKTADLIATSAELGAICVGATATEREALRKFGRGVGIAFQVQDDILDLLGSESTVGKSVGKDAEKGKMTLPIIHHLAHAQPRERAKTLLLLEQASGDMRHEHGAELVQALHATDSLAFARVAATKHIAEAKRELASLADSPARRLLLAMADAVVTREF